MRTYHYVPDSDPFMQEAKIARETLSGDPSYPVGAVLMKDGRVIARAGNGYNLGQANRHVCPRIVLECPSGTGYELCHLHDAPGHAEPMAIKAALDAGEDPSGSVLYMYGHYWACEPCWEALTQAGVQEVFLVEDAETVFSRSRVYAETLQPSVKTAYISGGLTNLPEAEREAKKAFYEALARASEEVGCRAYVPHLHTDPVAHAYLPAGQVHEHDRELVSAHDVIVAEVTHPSLGTGGELMLAREFNKPIVLVSRKGSQVSRFALGNPAVVYHIEYETEADACRQLKNVLRQL